MKMRAIKALICNLHFWFWFCLFDTFVCTKALKMIFSDCSITCVNEEMCWGSTKFLPRVISYCRAKVKLPIWKSLWPKKHKLSKYTSSIVFNGATVSTAKVGQHEKCDWQTNGHTRRRPLCICLLASVIQKIQGFHLTKEQGFWCLNFSKDHHTLIPRILWEGSSFLKMW